MKGFRQKFSPYVQQYEYDERKDCLVELKTMKNQQELIQSSEDCALDKILERFGYSNVSLNSVLNNHREDVSNLDFYDKSQDFNDLVDVGEYMQKAEDLKRQFNLPIDTPAERVYMECQTKLNDFLKKGVNVNEKKTIEKSEPSQLSQNSDQN